jgi:hypothetical protein
MVKTATIKEEGQQLQIPNETADEMPISLTYTQAKLLAKKLRPPASEKQKEHMQKLVDANRIKWEEKRKQKEEDAKRQKEEKEKTTTNILVKPKRIYKTKESITPNNSVNDADDDEDVEIIEEVVKKPKKKIIRKIVEEESDEEDDDVIQKTKKATKLVETVNKLDNAIKQMKSNNNRYDNLLSKIKF